MFVTVLDTAAGVWLDRNGLVTSSSRTNKGHKEHDPALELMRRGRHASASIGVRLYIYGGLRGGNVMAYQKNKYLSVLNCGHLYFFLIIPDLVAVFDATEASLKIFPCCYIVVIIIIVILYFSYDSIYEVEIT